MFVFVAMVGDGDGVEDVSSANAAGVIVPVASMPAASRGAECGVARVVGCCHSKVPLEGEWFCVIGYTIALMGSDGRCRRMPVWACGGIVMRICRPSVELPVVGVRFAVRREPVHLAVSPMHGVHVGDVPLGFACLALRTLIWSSVGMMPPWRIVIAWNAAPCLLLMLTPTARPVSPLNTVS